MRYALLATALLLSVLSNAKAAIEPGDVELSPFAEIAQKTGGDYDGDPELATFKIMFHIDVDITSDLDGENIYLRRGFGPTGGNKPNVRINDTHDADLTYATFLLTASPATVAGDTAEWFVIPAEGLIREFTFSAAFMPTMTGFHRLEIVQFEWTTDPNAPSTTVTLPGGHANTDYIFLNAVPEPASLSFVALAALSLVRRQR